MIRYRNLKFLGYPHYQVDNLGNIYRLKFWECKISLSQSHKIQNLYYHKQYHIVKLAKLFNTSSQTVSRIVKCQKFWVKMKPWLGSDKRYSIRLYDINSNKKRYFIHRLILEAFVGQCPEGMEVCHNDGNPINNNLINLRYDTRKNNMADKKKHGTYHIGETVNRVKLKKEDISIIRHLYKFCTQKEIGELYKVATSNISFIVNKKRWGHI